MPRAFITVLPVTATYNKKRLAEKTSAAEVLQKSLGKTKAENAELERRVKELEAKVAESEPVVVEEAQEEQEAA